MLTAPVTRAGPGGRPFPGRVDRLRVAAPWVWTGLCAAVVPTNGSLRDYVTGNAPSVMNVPTPSRDARGEVMSFTGLVQANQDFANNGNHNRAVDALTVLCRWRATATNATSQSGIFSKQATGTTNTWLIYTDAAVNTSAVRFGLNIGGTTTTSGASAALPTTAFTNIWIRWQTTQTATATYLTDSGTVAAASVATAALTGALTYTTPGALRIGGLETVARTSAGGDFSLGMVWNRRLSDQEMYSVTFDPFGFLRRA